MAEDKQLKMSRSDDDELKRLDIEERTLRLEHLRMTVENERARRDGILRAHQQQQRALDEANTAIIAQQSACRHKKGGKNLEGIINGNDSNYSVVKHMYPWGESTVLCTRCGKEWRKPSDDLKKSNAKEYARLSREYAEAMNFSTDNEPSGSMIFMVTPAASAARA